MHKVFKNKAQWCSTPLMYSAVFLFRSATDTCWVPLYISRCDLTPLKVDTDTGTDSDTDEPSRFWSYYYAKKLQMGLNFVPK